MDDPRIFFVPRDFEEQFLLHAYVNTAQGIETCGLLCGHVGHDSVKVTHLLVPPQTGTCNTVEMLNDQLVAEKLLETSLTVVGWIHTHPTQTAFLSSIDIHTQYSYQALLKEAVACLLLYNNHRPRPTLRLQS